MEDTTTGIIYCDGCGNEITLGQDDIDFVCDDCGDQCCCECIEVNKEMFV